MIRGLGIVAAQILFRDLLQLALLAQLCKCGVDGIQIFGLPLADGNGNDILGIRDDEGLLQLILCIGMLVQIGVQHRYAGAEEVCAAGKHKVDSLRAGVDADDLCALRLIPRDEGVRSVCGDLPVL